MKEQKYYILSNNKWELIKDETNVKFCKDRGYRKVSLFNDLYVFKGYGFYPTKKEYKLDDILNELDICLN